MILMSALQKNSCIPKNHFLSLTMRVSVSVPTIGFQTKHSKLSSGFSTLTSSLLLLEVLGAFSLGSDIDGIEISFSFFLSSFVSSHILIDDVETSSSTLGIFDGIDEKKLVIFLHAVLFIVRRKITNSTKQTAN